MVVPFVLAAAFPQDDGVPLAPERRYVQRELLFWEVEWAQMTKQEFKTYVRLERTTFDIVLREISPFFEPRRSFGRPSLPFDKRLALLLWRLASAQESFHAIALRFSK